MSGNKHTDDKVEQFARQASSLTYFLVAVSCFIVVSLAVGLFTIIYTLIA